jgi:hypothetical protein
MEFGLLLFDIFLKLSGRSRVFLPGFLFRSGYGHIITGFIFPCDSVALILRMLTKSKLCGVGEFDAGSAELPKDLVCGFA